MRLSRGRGLWIAVCCVGWAGCSAEAESPKSRASYRARTSAGQLEGDPGRSDNLFENPSDGSASDAQIELRVMTFNTLTGDINNQDGTDGGYRRHASEVVGRLILEQNVDIAFFQEVDSGISGRINDRAESKFYEEALKQATEAGRTPHTWHVWQRASHMIVSRFPLESTNADSAVFPPPQTAVVQTPAGRLRLFNIHAAPSCDANLSWFAEGPDRHASEPHLMSGDFNVDYAAHKCTSRNCDNASYQRCYHKIDSEYTLSDAGNVQSQVDYVMASRVGGWRVVQTDDIQFRWRKEEWSDHNPVIATLEWSPKTGTATDKDP
jgi:endonuclease/exonuclease/phosphatase family metal-dependent hydrolase